MKSLLYFVFLNCILLQVYTVSGQTNFATNGPHNKNNSYYVFQNATIHVSGEVIVEKGMMIVLKDKITYVGAKTKVPENAIEIDLKGKHIYPSFIELASNFGVAEVKRSSRGFSPQYETSKKGPYYWNEAVKPENRVEDSYVYDAKKAAELRKIGFGTVLTHQQDGIVRGSASVVTLNDKSDAGLLKERAAANYSFKKGTSNQQYPSSMMGSIALIRQFFYDAAYYSHNKKTEPINLSLEAQLLNNALPSFFYVDESLSIGRAERIAKEFNKKFIYVGIGDEYQDVANLKTNNASVVVPINFPKPYDIEDPMNALYVPLRDLKHWELAPSNLKILSDNAINFSISATNLEKTDDFLTNLKKAISRGLPKNIALNALTKNPAQMLAIYDKVGSIEVGKLANFIIVSADVFEENAAIQENWVQGERFSISALDAVDLRGEYNLNVNQMIRTLKVEGTLEKPKAHLNYDIVADSVSKSGDLVIDKVTGRPIKITQKKKVDVVLNLEHNFINLSYSLVDGAYRLSGNVNFDSGSWDGKVQLPSGEWQDWTAIRKEKNKVKSDTTKMQVDSVPMNKFMYPMQAFGWDSLPKLVPVLIKNATVWTCEAEGTLQADVLLRDGKISAIAKVLDVVDKTTIVIDGTGKHLTPGIIDEHSHIGIHKGVNEGF